MSIETRKIILKKGGPAKIEKTIGTSTIKAVRGKPVEVPLEDLQMWLNTGRFEEYKPSHAKQAQKETGAASGETAAAADNAGENTENGGKN